MTQEVAIIQRRMTHYRVPLFEALKQELAERDVRLRVLHGDPNPAEAAKNDDGKLAWAEHLPTRYMLNNNLVWQPFARQTAGCDMVIVTQENKLLNNLPLLFRRRRDQLLAFWGHGQNMQSASPDGLAERFKRRTTTRVDWWFAYTELSAQVVRKAGFNTNRLTVLNNSIDTSSLKRDVQSASQSAQAELRQALQLPDGPLAVFIGSLYADKNMPFLIEAALQLHARIPGFQLAIAGDGPDRHLVQEAVQSHAFIHWLGPVGGKRKAQLLATANLILNPGALGLGVLDAFVGGLPLVTTRDARHGPEIAYLRNGHNGLQTPTTLQAFTDSVTALMNDQATMNALQHGARESANLYSIEQMTVRFADGICNALGRP